MRNFETQPLKVNDKTGTPIEVAAVVVWQVVDTAQAMFEVDEYTGYVCTQSEAALRGLIMQYPYEAYDDNGVTLSSHMAEISEQLTAETQERLERAGVQALEARISHLAYPPEIAAVMLQRQQAMATVAARQKIVEGAVGIVEQVLDRLSEKNLVDLDAETKRQLVSNLLVVLCSERQAQPVLDTSAPPTQGS